jgi:hypothetical protein
MHKVHDGDRYMYLASSSPRMPMASTGPERRPEACYMASRLSRGGVARTRIDRPQRTKTPRVLNAKARMSRASIAAMGKEEEGLARLNHWQVSGQLLDRKLDKRLK